MNRADPFAARHAVADHLRDAGLDTVRFVDVRNNEKMSYDHNQRPPDDDRLSGNYGVYAGRGAGEDGDGWLVDVDIDDYAADGETDGLDAVLGLPETLAVETPHTDGETGGHRFYRVTGNVAEAMRDVTGASNPSPSWGEVRVANQYVVGPGSQLDGCERDACDECEQPDGGMYRIAESRPIATITADELADVLRADPEYSGENGAGGDMDPAEYDADGETNAEAVAQGHDWITNYLAYGDDDRSQADFRACCVMIEHGVAENDAHTLLDSSSNTKVSERGGDYWRSTWNSALRAVGTNDTAENGETGETGESGERRGVPTTETRGKSDENHPTDGGTAALTPTAVMAVAGLDPDNGESVSDLNDRQKAASVWELVERSDDVHVRVRRDNASLWAYDDGVWKPEGKRALRHAARQALGSMHYAANVLAELEAQARSDLRVEAEPDEFGVETGTVAVENGLVDLNAAADGAGDDAIRNLQPADHALTRLPVEYDPDAEYDEWAGYVDEWAESGKADALQEYVGYCLHIGAMPIHRAVLLVGSGANGKGTFLTVVRALLGEDNTSSTELQTLANEKDAVADFYGALANIDDDLSARKLGQGKGMFKKLVGGDRVRARRLYEDGFEFDATGKHLYAANKVPNVNVPDDDEAFWRRWLLVEFPNYYPPGSNRDTGLRDRLTTPEALSGVLNWAIDGRRRLLEQEHFTNEDRLSHDKRTRWQSWGDTIDKFIGEHVERDPDAARITTGDAYQRFVAWCRENGEEPDSQRSFTDKLKTENVGFGEHRIDGTKTRGYTALGFDDNVPDPNHTHTDGSDGHLASLSE